MPYIGRSIIPSHMGLDETPRHYDGEVFNNIRLRYGEVQQVIPPEDDRSRSKKFTEYSVLVQFRANDTATAKLYEHCSLMNVFGGLADQEVYTLRHEDQPSSQSGKASFGKGAKVILLCVNGETERAIIIGGIRDPEDDDKGEKDKGHHYYWLFNGVNVAVNNDGEYIVKYNGKTKIDGSVDSSVDSKTAGSFFTLTKDGFVKFHAAKKFIIDQGDAFELGQATDAMLLGQSFRDAQKSMNNQLKGYFDGLKSLLQTAAISLQTAGGSMSTPIAGAVLAAPQITAAATALLAAVNVVGQISQTIDNFEQQAQAKNSFLSDKNKAD